MARVTGRSKDSKKLTKRKRSRGASSTYANEKGLSIKWPRFGVRVIAGLFVVVGVVSASYFSYAALNHAAARPIQNVAIEGDFIQVGREQLADLLDPLIADGFLQLPLMTVKQELETHPWIANVNVSRRWPDTLLVTVAEHQAIARWGEIGFLNQNGDIIEVEQSPFLTSLPWLEGNRSESKRLMQRYQQLVQMLRPYGLNISSFHADEMNVMTVNLNNGLILYLGEDQIMQKFQRFLLVMQRSLKDRLSEIQSIDLRYDNGLAVQWQQMDVENVVANHGL